MKTISLTLAALPLAPMASLHAVEEENRMKTDHFYCAVGDQGRVIALATSKDLKAQTNRGAKP